jgi:hypothetical protein
MTLIPSLPQTKIGRPFGSNVVAAQWQALADAAWVGPEGAFARHVLSH